MTKSLRLGVPFVAVDALQSTADTTSVAFALPNASDMALSWQSSFAVAPGAVDLRLLASVDGTNFIEIDNTILTTGDIRLLSPVNYTHVKVRQASRTGATAYTTVTLLLKRR